MSTAITTFHIGKYNEILTNAVLTKSITLKQIFLLSLNMMPSMILYTAMFFFLPDCNLYVRLEANDRLSSPLTTEYIQQCGKDGVNIAEKWKTASHSAALQSPK